MTSAGPPRCVRSRPPSWRAPGLTLPSKAPPAASAPAGAKRRQAERGEGRGTISSSTFSATRTTTTAAAAPWVDVRARMGAEEGLATGAGTGTGAAKETGGEQAWWGADDFNPALRRLEDLFGMQLSRGVIQNAFVKANFDEMAAMDLILDYLNDKNYGTHDAVTEEDESRTPSQGGSENGDGGGGGRRGGDDDDTLDEEEIIMTSAAVAQAKSLTASTTSPAPRTLAASALKVMSSPRRESLFRDLHALDEVENERELLQSIQHRLDLDPHPVLCDDGGGDGDPSVLRYSPPPHVSPELPHSPQNGGDDAIVEMQRRILQQFELAKADEELARRLGSAASSPMMHPQQDPLHHNEEDDAALAARLEQEEYARSLQERLEREARDQVLAREWEAEEMATTPNHTEEDFLLAQALHDELRDQDQAVDHAIAEALSPATMKRASSRTSSSVKDQQQELLQNLKAAVPEASVGEILHAMEASRLDFAKAYDLLMYQPNAWDQGRPSFTKSGTLDVGGATEAVLRTYHTLRSRLPEPKYKDMELYDAAMKANGDLGISIIDLVNRYPERISELTAINSALHESRRGGGPAQGGYDDADATERKPTQQFTLAAYMPPPSAAPHGRGRQSQRERAMVGMVMSDSTGAAALTQLTPVAVRASEEYTARSLCRALDKFGTPTRLEDEDRSSAASMSRTFDRARMNSQREVLREQYKRVKAPLAEEMAQLTTKLMECNRRGMFNDAAELKRRKDKVLSEITAVDEEFHDEIFVALNQALVDRYKTEEGGKFVARDHVLDVDFHGLSRAATASRAAAVLDLAHNRGWTSLRLITGRGNHSMVKGGELTHTVQEVLRKYHRAGKVLSVDPSSDGGSFQVKVRPQFGYQTHLRPSLTATASTSASRVPVPPPSVPTPMVPLTSHNTGSSELVYEEPPGAPPPRPATFTLSTAGTSRPLLPSQLPKYSLE